MQATSLWRHRLNTSERESCARWRDHRDAFGSSAGHPNDRGILPGYEASTWHGVGVPRGTPTEIVEKLNKEIDAALADPKLRARLAGLGQCPLRSPADFGKLIADETEKWAKVIRAANIKAE